MPSIKGDFEHFHKVNMEYMDSSNVFTSYLSLSIGFIFNCFQGTCTTKNSWTLTIKITQNSNTGGIFYIKAHSQF